MKVFWILLKVFFSITAEAPEFGNLSVAEPASASSLIPSTGGRAASSLSYDSWRNRCWNNDLCLGTAHITVHASDYCTTRESTKDLIVVRWIETTFASFVYFHEI